MDRDRSRNRQHGCCHDGQRDLAVAAPSPRGLSTKDSPQNQASYVFNGPVNTTAQGGPVPVLYGELEIGSAVASAGIYAEDQL